jgi:palmitoyltransferase
MSTISRLWRRLIRDIVGPAMAILGLCLVCIITYCYVFWILPDVIDARINPRIATGHYLLSLYLFVNLVWNQIMASMTNPGKPPPISQYGPALHDFVAVVREANPNANANGSNNAKNPKRHVTKQFRLNVKNEPGMFYEYCLTCNSIKPPRTHHCSVIDQCVLTFDHYCPWTGNTIGHYNYRYFILFMGYLFASVCYVFVMTVLDIRLRDRLAFTELNILSGTFDIFHSGPGSDDMDFLLFTVFAVTLAAAVSVGLLFSFHIWLVITNQTTVEYFTNTQDARFAEEEGRPWKNPFDKGTWRKNSHRIFGTNIWRNILLPASSPPPTPDYFFYMQAGEDVSLV